MGYSHQRRAAARTVLRARELGDESVVADAEEGVSGYLDEDLKEYLSEHFPLGLPNSDPIRQIAIARHHDHERRDGGSTWVHSEDTTADGTVVVMTCERCGFTERECQHDRSQWQDTAGQPTDDVDEGVTLRCRRCARDVT